MKSVFKNLAFCAVLGASGSAFAAVVPFPNGDFETPGGASWDKNSFAGNQVISFPSTGGNTGGYGSIVSNELGGYAVLVTNGGLPYPLASLNLVAGKTYTFSYDMITSVAGPNKGGIKIESWSSTAGISDSKDQRVTSASTGWATYSYAYTIDPAATHIKVVPLWTPGETVGFDNVRVDNTPIVPPPVVPVIPNSGFEIPGGPFNVGADWAYFAGGFTGTHFTTGGNPGGNTVIDATVPGTYGVLVAKGNAYFSLAELGLTAGGTYIFQMDMKLLAGQDLGGLKLELSGADFVEKKPTAQQIAALPNPITEWNTYSFEFTIPAGWTQFKVVPVWGVASRVAYDNVKILPPPPLAAQIQAGTTVSWNAANPLNSYQPQESPTGLPGSFTNLGPKISGNAVTTVFAAVPAPFYQVLETTPDLFANAVLNPGFETSAVSSAPADNWSIPVPANNPNAVMTVVGSYPEVALAPFAGTKMLVIDSTTPATGPVTPPDTNVRSDSWTVTGNTVYTLSFQAAHLFKIGGANPQFYFQFFGSDPIFGDPVFLGDSFTSFQSLGGSWTKVERTFTTPAAATSMTIGFIQAMGAGNGWRWVTLIDDVSLLTPSTPGVTTVIPATPAAGVQISWNSKSGKTYQVKSSIGLLDWENFGTAAAGTGGTMSVSAPLTPPNKFYRVEETP